MSYFIIYGIVSIPIYILYNFICYKRKNISAWIKDGFLSDDTLKIVNDAYYEFQYKSSIKVCILLSIIIIVGIRFEWDSMFLAVFLLVFHLSTYFTKYLAFDRNYIDRIDV